MLLQAASYMLLINKSVIFFVHVRLDRWEEIVL